MRLIIVITLLALSQSAFSQSANSYENERILANEQFVRGTELLKRENKEFDPKAGLNLLLESAKHKYQLAPFGLCVALSVTPEILDLKEAYSWCYVAEKIGDKFSTLATKQGLKILEKLEKNEGATSVNQAKEMGIAKYRQ